MLFNSFTFILFFIIVYSLYLCLSHKKQNIMLLVASYIFYGWWDWRFLSLIAISTIIDYFVGIKIADSDDDKKKRFYRNISIVANLGILCIFKYFNFFIGSTISFLTAIGFQPHPLALNIVLPVGISFYTFQTMSYSWDVYRKEVKPVKNFLDFALFVSFFPQLVAGPIERAKNLIPQIIKPRKVSLESFYEGSYLVFWGLFKKIYVADLLAPKVNLVFNNWSYGTNTWVDVIMATWMFAWQIYCDFSGYSDIARGISKMMGFNLMVNFNLPYFAKNPSDFWRRWHISLSTWLRDYLYKPLGGSRNGKFLTYRNLFITMLLGGLWHGANWNFIIWGIYQGILLMLHKAYLDIVSKHTRYQHISKTKTYMFISWFSTVLLVAYGWLIFRSQSLSQLLEMTKTIFFGLGDLGAEILYPSMLFKIFWFLFVIQLFQYFKKELMVVYKTKHFYLRTIFYCLTFYLIIQGGLNS